MNEGLESYSASNEYIKNALPVRAPGRVEEHTYFQDPVREFERVGPEAAIAGNMFQWHTFTRDRRLELVKALKEPKVPDSPSAEEILAAKQRRWRYLNYIIQEESRNMGDGAMDIAAIAFNYLFPRNGKAEPVK
jgi:hypothetical protein